MAPAYDHKELADRWLTRWEVDGTYRVDLGASACVGGNDEPFYNCVEFPYPSGEGLHVGHVFKYGGADVVGRMWRMRGRRVFQPIGFDSFGIHSENYARRVGEHPAPLMERTTARFAMQLRSAAIGFDWDHVVVTSDPAYYRWTQWVFLRLFVAGLIYRADGAVLWCSSCATVLAREQVDDDRCERCDTVVESRVLRQWFVRTTQYADRLVDGLDALDWPERAKRLQRAWIGRNADALRLHDWVISRQRYWGTPIPIVYCDGCGPIAVPDDELPVLLDSPVERACPRCGGEARRETDVCDTFFDSSWYFLRYLSTDRDDVPWDDARVARWMPIDFYAGGPEHVTRHHLYARFMGMALHDLGLTPFAEPFARMRLGGLLVRNGAKMSKSRGNVVTPDDYIDEVGADALRVGLLFSARWDEGGDFTDEAVVGASRFLDRVWRLATSDLPDTPVCGVAAAAAITAVTRGIETLAFNVAIARLMEYTTALRRQPSRDGVLALLRLLAPFAPIVTEELWLRMGETGSIHHARWPAS